MLVEDRADTILKFLVLGGLFSAMILVAACSEMVGIGRFQAPEEQELAAVEPEPQGSGLAPEAIMGKGAGEVTTLLGEPSLLREEQGAQVWQYTSTSCVLLLYLYADELNAYYVTHMEARGRGDGPSDVPACLAATPAA